MLSGNSVSTLTLKQMTKEEAAALIRQLLGCYPSPNLYDPETYVATMVSLLCGYPLWAGQRAVRQLSFSSKFIPSVAEIAPILNEEVRVARRAAEWEADAQRMIAARPKNQPLLPRPPRPTIEELKAKHGENWGIDNPDRKRSRRLSMDEELAKLRREFGDLVDSVPDAPDREAAAERLGRIADRAFSEHLAQIDAAAAQREEASCSGR